ncbi:bifunctional DNA primase/polymerase [Streptomyces sp. NRRL S-337]|uniref:bifunctional DNA primase/polymerase n=1 Tax=Streptomyces sp. NRRL S-337 TaxID=1463900 RepID=UPI00099DFB83|nr:bifunctional DNA primase/polymerase [Streptomyces sp. NRRL S-337]
MAGKQTTGEQTAGKQTAGEPTAGHRPSTDPPTGPPPRSDRDGSSTPTLTPPPDAHTAALTEALVAAERGYPVIPLTRAKLPALRSPHRGHPEVPPCHGGCGRLGHGVHDASTDPFTIRRMFAAAPWATGYGIACGLPPHHLIGLDLDTKNGADGLTALLFLAEAHDFPVPPTIMVRTPSGGRHVWFTGPPSPPVPNSVGRLAPGIDVRGAGGYLVGPGSLTAHGRYVLAPNAPARPAPVPSALLTLLTDPPTPTRHASPQHGRAGYEPPPGVPPQPAAALVRFVRSSPVGQRNARLFWAACRAYEDGLGPELAARLTEAACHTGLPEHEARATITSASRHR